MQHIQLILHQLQIEYHLVLILWFQVLICDFLCLFILFNEMTWTSFACEQNKTFEEVIIAVGNTDFHIFHNFLMLKVLMTIQGNNQLINWQWESLEAAITDGLSSKLLAGFWHRKR